MKIEVIYQDYELDKGICTCCLEKSNEIVVEDGRCIECIEDEKFYEQTMKGL